MNESTKESLALPALRYAGYGLLILTLSNVLDALIPPRFMQPVWEIQLVGNLVGTVPVLLIGLVLVFYGDLRARTYLERVILKYFSWLSLILGISYLLLVLLGLSATVRINNDNNNQASLQLSQQVLQLKQAKEQIDKATDADLKKFADTLKSQNSSLKLDANNPAELRQKLTDEIAKNEKTARIQNEENKKRTFLRLVKKSLKWNLEALISGLLLIGIWRVTSWTRSRRNRNIIETKPID